jgi:hypothetical protein
LIEGAAGRPAKCVHLAGFLNARATGGEITLTTQVRPSAGVPRREADRASRWEAYGADVFMSGDLVRPIDIAATGSGCYRSVERSKARSEVRAFVEMAAETKFNAGKRRLAQAQRYGSTACDAPVATARQQALLADY